MTEYKETIPTLWNATQEFMRNYPQYINRGKESLLNWLTDDDFVNYNGCHFWSNFEVSVYIYIYYACIHVELFRLVHWTF